MAVLKEYECIVHGDFEGKFEGDAACPHGCTGSGMVQRVFRTAPAHQSAAFGNLNRNFEQLAREHGLTDMSNRSGEGMRKSTWQGERRLQQATEMVIGKSRGGLQGQDAGDYFKPLKDFGQVGANAQGSLGKAEQRTVTDAAGKSHTYGIGRTVLSNGMELGMPAVKVESKFDGRAAGLPAGDA